MDDDELDVALAAYVVEGRWQVHELDHDQVVDVPGLAHALRAVNGADGAVGLVAVDEDFFVVVRVVGDSTRVLLSDVTAADEWELAGSALAFLGLPRPDITGAFDRAVDGFDEEVPAGELGLLADLGMSALAMGELLDDVELYPDEMLSEVALRLGFGELFDDVVGLTSA